MRWRCLLDGVEVHGGLTGRLPRRAEFKNAARKCFQLIDKDQGGTLSHSEIVEALDEDKSGEIDIEEWRVLRRP